MNMIKTALAATALAFAFATTAFAADSTAAAGTAATTTAPKKVKAPKAPKGPAKPHSAASIECSKQADAKSLHGKPRKTFRETCMKGQPKA